MERDRWRHLLAKITRNSLTARAFPAAHAPSARHTGQHPHAVMTPTQTRYDCFSSSGMGTNSTPIVPTTCAAEGQECAHQGINAIYVHQARKWVSKASSGNVAGVGLCSAAQASAIEQQLGQRPGQTTAAAAAAAASSSSAAGLLQGGGG